MNAWFETEWAGVAQVFRLRRAVKEGDQEREETVSGVTNLPRKKANASRLLAFQQAHWRIELGFRLLKDHLGLRFLWSAKMQAIGAQRWASVILAQILHALQVQLAAGLGVETFVVSLELLWRYLPELSQRGAQQGTSFLQVLKEVGVAIKLIRPSTRLRRSVPIIDWQETTLPPVDLVCIRPPRYAHKTSGSRSYSRTHIKKEPGVI